jgi:hypothetical protein
LQEKWTVASCPAFSGRRGTYITSNTLQMVFFMMASLAFGEDEQDMEAGFQAMEDAMPMLISDFTGDMQALLERGEVHIAVQHDGETFMQIDEGQPLGWYYWQRREPSVRRSLWPPCRSCDQVPLLRTRYLPRMLRASRTVRHLPLPRLWTLRSNHSQASLPRLLWLPRLLRRASPRSS